MKRGGFPKRAGITRLSCKVNSGIMAPKHKFKSGAAADNGRLVLGLKWKWEKREVHKSIFVCLVLEVMTSGGLGPSLSIEYATKMLAKQYVFLWKFKWAQGFCGEL